MFDTEEFYRMLGKRVRRLRIQRRLTLEELAARAGISASFLGNIERGNRKMSLDSFYRIALALNSSANDLMGMQDSATRHFAPELLRNAVKLDAFDASSEEQNEKNDE